MKLVKLFLFIFLSNGLFAQVPELVVPAGHGDQVYLVKFSADGKYLFSVGTGAKSVKIWDTKTGRLLKNLAVSDFPSKIEIAQDNKTVVVATAKEIYCYAFPSFKLLNKTGHGAKDAVIRGNSLYLLNSENVNGYKVSVIELSTFNEKILYDEVNASAPASRCARDRRRCRRARPDRRRESPGRAAGGCRRRRRTSSPRSPYSRRSATSPGAAVDTGGQAGLLDVVPHPDYAKNGWLYFAYSDPQTRGNQQVSLTRIVRGKIRGNALVEQQTIFQQIHTWVIALFPEQAQAEVFGSSRDPVVCASLNPSKNRARKVADGYVIEHGRFTFCSGAAAREWALLGALITDDAGAVVDVGCLLVPGAELTELDDWFVSGLQATGSLSLVAQDLFIPAHRFLSYHAATAYRTPGAAINRGSVYQAAFVPMLVLNLAGPALGAAEFALRAFIANLNDKGAAAGAYPLPGLPRIEAPATHEVIATARMQIDSARLLTAQAGRTIRQAAEARCPLTPEQSAKVNLETSYAVRECLRAVQSLFLQAGGGVLHPSHPLQGAYQDVLAINCHGFLAHEANLTLYGSLVTGHAQPTAFL